MAWWDDFKQGVGDAYAEGKPDHRLAFFAGREDRGLDQDAPRISSTLGVNPTFTRLRDLLGISQPKHREAREAMGMGIKPTTPGKVGQILGTIGNDLTQDHSRELWWLINAPQALANVTQEALLAKSNPDLFGAEIVQDQFGSIPTSDSGVQRAEKADLISDPVRRVKKKGIGAKKVGDSMVFTRRKYAPGLVSSLAIPSGVAINAGIGLLNPVGGMGGYEAVIPNAEDPTKTDNVIGEIAAKYILGRTGGLLPYDEFKKVRPDVSEGEYKAYKAFKYDKSMDWDPRDGDLNIFPMGVLKVTDDGIHGPEAQFLGRSLPAIQTGMPLLGALAGTTLGASNRLSRGRPIRGGFLGGVAGLATGGGLGYLVEQERRRRNAAENEAYGSI